MNYPIGLDPYIARQHLLHHTYSPLISVQSSRHADVVFQSLVGNSDVSTLEVLRAYGNNAKLTVPNQSFKITNTQLITKTYPSFPVRFELSLPELLSVMLASKRNLVSELIPTFPQHQLNQLFSISSLELLLKHTARESTPEKELYLNYFNKIITSNNIVPFDTFNHPISQIFVIDYENDTIESLRNMIVEFRNFNFPKYFQIDDLLIHVFILFDSNRISATEIATLQSKIKSNLNTFSTAISIVSPDANAESSDSFKISLNENSTIDEDLQRISLQQSSSNPTNDVLVPKTIDSILRTKLYEYINKFLIPHMQQKIRIWDDQMLQPKKSITGRFFSASKKFFNNNNSDSNLSSLTSSNLSNSFNYHENYYYKLSPEQTIRKLADWSLILKDFKYAYSTYELIKKDYTNDKAWVYVASTQEMCIVSLLLAQTQQISTVSTPPDKNTLRKIRHDIIEPYIDNLSYTFKSRLNLKTYSLKTLTIVIELLLCMCLSFNISWWWNDLIEKYMLNCINEFDTHLSSTNQNSQVIRAILYERLGYSTGKCIYLNDENKNMIDLNQMTPIGYEPKPPTPIVREGEEVVEGLYINPHKLYSSANNAVIGLTRFRKSAIWYLLSLKEWLILKNYPQIEFLLNNLRLTFNSTHISDELWYDRHDLLLGFIKRCLREIRATAETDNREQILSEAKYL